MSFCKYTHLTFPLRRFLFRVVLTAYSSSKGIIFRHVARGEETADAALAPWHARPVWASLAEGARPLGAQRRRARVSANTKDSSAGHRNGTCSRRHTVFFK